MAYSTISKPSLHFNTKLYTGTGSSNALTGVGFQPDWIWIKSRNIDYDNNVFDVIRGTEKRIKTNANSLQDTVSGSVTAFGTDGFTVGSDAGVNASTKTYAAWNWKAGNSAGSANNDGNIASTVSVNTTAGFSIVKYTGTSYAQTVGHGLGAVPKMIILKEYSASNASQWQVYHNGLGATKRMELNTTNPATTTSGIWNDTTPTSSVFSIGTSGAVTESGANYIAYCFAEKTGYSKFGTYTGNASANGPFVYTGFKPAWIMLKNSTDTGDNWTIYDSKRDIDNPSTQMLFAQDNGVEASGNNMDILSNGFKQRNTSNGNNGSGDLFVYMAFAEEPLVANVGNGVPATAR